MGAVPSKDTTSLFSYFRGSYEVGLIPLTKHFFGKEVQQGIDIENNAQQQQQQPFHSQQVAFFSSYPLAGAAAVATAGNGPTTTNTNHHFGDGKLSSATRAQLRSQLLQMRQDPAVRYSNARDAKNMAESLAAHLRDLASGEGGGATTTNSVAVKTERRNSENQEVTEADSAEMERKSGAEEQSPLLSKYYWDIMPHNNFHEEDLDLFLELVEKALYESDEAMIADATYAGEEDIFANRTTATADGNEKPPGTPVQFMPIPCALCLAYPEGKERQGCFALDGRNINIIGYFGCLTAEMQEAFKVVKQEIAPGADAALADENALYLNTAILTSAGDRTLERVLVLAAVMLRQQFHTAYRRRLIALKKASGRIVPASTTCNNMMNGGGCGGGGGAVAATTNGSCFDNANAIGDVTTAQQQQQQQMLLGELLCSQYYAPSDPLFASPLPPLPQAIFTPNTSPYMAASTSVMANGSTVSSGPQYDRSHFFRGSSAAAASTAADEPGSTVPVAAAALAGSPQLFSAAGAAAAAGGSGLPLTAAEEDSITWGFFRRLERINVFIESSSNNYSALKSLTENFAFLHCQVLIDANEGEMVLTDLPDLPPEETPIDGAATDTATAAGGNTDFATCDTPPLPSLKSEPSEVSSGSNSPSLKSGTSSATTPMHRVNASRRGRSNIQFLLSPGSRVLIHLKSSYFRQAVMWASCLFHYPARLPGGNWVQYKLKDECDHLRQILQNKDMLIAHWRKHDVAHASSYLGPLTKRLLAHVKALQEETEQARALPLAHWEKERVFVNQDGRKYALHQSPYGTMLIGVRAHGVSCSSGGGNLGVSVVGTSNKIASSNNINNTNSAGGGGGVRKACGAAAGSSAIHGGHMHGHSSIDLNTMQRAGMQSAHMGGGPSATMFMPDQRFSVPLTAVPGRGGSTIASMGHGGFFFSRDLQQQQQQQQGRDSTPIMLFSNAGSGAGAPIAIQFSGGVMGQQQQQPPPQQQQQVLYTTSSQAELQRQQQLQAQMMMQGGVFLQQSNGAPVQSISAQNLASVQDLTMMNATPGDNAALPIGGVLPFFSAQGVASGATAQPFFLSPPTTTTTPVDDTSGGGVSLVGQQQQQQQQQQAMFLNHFSMMTAGSQQQQQQRNIQLQPTALSLVSGVSSSQGLSSPGLRQPTTMNGGASSTPSSNNNTPSLIGLSGSQLTTQHQQQQQVPSAPPGYVASMSASQNAPFTPQFSVHADPLCSSRSSAHGGMQGQNSGFGGSTPLQLPGATGVLAPPRTTWLETGSNPSSSRTNHPSALHNPSVRYSPLKTNIFPSNGGVIGISSGGSAMEHQQQRRSPFSGAEMSSFPSSFSLANEATPIGDLSGSGRLLFSQQAQQQQGVRVSVMADHLNINQDHRFNVVPAAATTATNPFGQHLSTDTQKGLIPPVISNSGSIDGTASGAPLSGYSYVMLPSGQVGWQNFTNLTGVQEMSRMGRQTQPPPQLQQQQRQQQQQHTLQSGASEFMQQQLQTMMMPAGSNLQSNQYHHQTALPSATMSLAAQQASDQQQQQQQRTASYGSTQLFGGTAGLHGGSYMMFQR